MASPYRLPARRLRDVPPHRPSGEPSGFRMVWMLCLAAIGLVILRCAMAR